MFFFYLFRLSLFLFIVVLVVVETDVLIGHGGVEVGMRVGKLGLVGCSVGWLMNWVYCCATVL